MSVVAEPEDAPKKTSRLMPLLIGIVMLVLGSGGGFYAVKQGLIGGAKTHDDLVPPQASDDHAAPAQMDEIAFVALDPLVISLPRSGSRSHLRFAAQLEVDPAHAADVEAVKPRIVDVLNGYLRAVDIAELEDPTALMRLRGQMLRRVQIVTGEGYVRDFLIMEFVLN